ncbi:hypothetical protein [Paracoccus fistulariae]|uniref:hypothetical protein n=1 Tax=Paracoccus fistulariae TaxID=658446 RepID=UPI00232F8E3D|nr:hypothetical protein [Paracoccus fistulariae]MDB6183176.1 hypothetical protein [Paracoccus fistulariae]
MFRRWYSLCFAAIFCLALSACTQPPGAARFIQYTEAFTASRQASEALFDLLEVAERDQARLAYSAASAEFDPSRPYLYTNLSAPPLAREYRASFDAISQYNQLMVALITGENAGVLTKQSYELATGAFALAGTAISTEQLQGIVPVMEIISTVAKDALTGRDRRVFAEELAQSSEAVITLMRNIRSGGPLIYNMLRAAGGRADDATRRKLMADWLVLMDHNIETLQAAVNAAKNSSRASVDLKAIQERLTELESVAESIKGSLAELAN